MRVQNGQSQRNDLVPIARLRQKAAARSQRKLTIEDVLDTGLPRAYDKPLYAQKCSAIFGYILESYPERDAGVYALAS